MGRFLRALFSLALRYTGVMITICIGAAIFTEIENVGLEEQRTQLQYTKTRKAIEEAKLKEDFETRLNVSINDTVFVELVQRVRNLSTKEPPNKWDFVTGAHFAFTIVSTIGYGVIVPTRDATRVATMIYAMIGIPIFLYAMAAAGNIKTILGENLIDAIEIKLMKRSQVRHKKWKVVIFAITTCILELIASSGLVYKAEDWTFFIAFYFWFISASTIGFGDYVLSFKGNNQVSAGMMVAIFFITLCLMSDLGCIFGTISEIIEEGGQRRAKKGLCKSCFRGESIGDGTQNNGDETNMQTL